MIAFIPVAEHAQAKAMQPEHKPQIETKPCKPKLGQATLCYKH